MTIGRAYVPYETLHHPTALGLSRMHSPSTQMHLFIFVTSGEISDG